METNGASGEITTGGDGISENKVAGDAGESQGQETGNEAAQGATQGAEGQADNEVLQDLKDGEPIPRERWNQFYAKHKETETKYQQALDFVETIQSDPNFRQKWIESLAGGNGGQETVTNKESPQAKQPPSAVRTYISENPVFKNSPEHQVIFNGLVDALADDFESHLQSGYVSKKELQEIIAPIRRYVGQTENSRFFEKNPQASTYKNKIAEVMREHPTLNLQQAFILSSSTDTKTRQAGVDRMNKSQDKLKSTPITGRSVASGVTTKTPLPQGNEMIREAVKRAFAKVEGN